MKLSVIVPVYNDRASVRPFVDRVVPVLQGLEGVDAWEVVFVNDGSTDGSLEEAQAVHARDARFKVLSLARNFGYHSVLVAGLKSADADLYAVIDVDAEDPPELLSKFYEAIRGGAQVAYGIRSKREEPGFITWLRGLFYHINRYIADSPTVLWMAEFVMITREVRDAILAPRTTYPFLRAEIAHVGFRRVGIEYLRHKRAHGATHYNLWTMTKFAVAGFLASSTFPLRTTLYVAAFLGVAYPLAVCGLGLSAWDAAALAAVLSFYFLLVTVPMLALYLARTYKNGMDRPVFYVDRTRSSL